MDLDEADGVTSRVTVFAAMQKQQRAKAGMKVLPMWECCQFHCCQFPIVD